jgi:hypothetical protein
MLTHCNERTFRKPERFRQRSIRLRVKLLRLCEALATAKVTLKWDEEAGMKPKPMGLLGSILFSLALVTPGAALDLERRALLGITAVPVPTSAGLNGPGVLAGHVVAGSAAEQAGVIAGDVVVSVDGAPLAEVDEFLRAVRRTGPVTA